MNVQYHANLEVGGQVVSGIMDTGSFELVVVSTRCEICTDPPYDRNRSTTYHESSKEDKMVTHHYGSGPTTSRVGYEHVSVGPLVAWNQTFYELQDHNITALHSASFDAIVGIGGGGDEGTPSLLSGFNVSEYSVCLERGSFASGWLTWGGDLEDKSIALQMPVVGEHHWAVALTRILPAGLSSILNEEQMAAAGVLLCGDGCAAVLDSGTSLIAAPSTALQGLSLILPEVHPNCSNFADMPTLELDLGGHRLLLPPEAYVLRMTGTQVEADSVWDILHFRPKVLKVDECFMAFMPINRRTKYGPLWILGMPFFREFHVTFDGVHQGAKRSVYIANAGDSCEPEKLEAEPVSSELRDDHPFPDMTVTQVKRSRRIREPLTVDAKSLLFPRFDGDL
jgi:hypothetical protein